MEFLRILIADVEKIPEAELRDAEREYDPEEEELLGELPLDLARLFTFVHQHVDETADSSEKVDEAQNEQYRQGESNHARTSLGIAMLADAVFWPSVRFHFAIFDPDVQLGIRKGRKVVSTTQHETIIQISRN